MFESNEINITDILTDIIKEISYHSGSFSHINTEKVLVCTASNRSNSRGGIYGKLVPLRFKDGSQFLEYRKKVYTIPELISDNKKLLYIIYFYMPKFYDLTPLDKLNVIFHELYHISPLFNGDIRRMSEKKTAHGHSRNHFNSLFKEEAQMFYNHIIKSDYFSFLSMNTKELYNRYNSVKGRRMKMPKPVPIEQ